MLSTYLAYYSFFIFCAVRKILPLKYGYVLNPKEHVNLEHAFSFYLNLDYNFQIQSIYDEMGDILDAPPEESNLTLFGGLTTTYNAFLLANTSLHEELVKFSTFPQTNFSLPNKECMLKLSLQRIVDYFHEDIKVIIKSTLKTQKSRSEQNIRSEYLLRARLGDVLLQLSNEIRKFRVNMQNSLYYKTPLEELATFTKTDCPNITNDLLFDLLECKYNVNNLICKGGAARLQFQNNYFPIASISLAGNKIENVLVKTSNNSILEVFCAENQVLFKNCIQKYDSSCAEAMAEDNFAKILSSCRLVPNEAERPQMGPDGIYIPPHGGHIENQLILDTKGMFICVPRQVTVSQRDKNYVFPPCYGINSYRTVNLTLQETDMVIKYTHPLTTEQSTLLFSSITYVALTSVITLIIFIFRVCSAKQTPTRDIQRELEDFLQLNPTRR